MMGAWCAQWDGQGGANCASVHVTTYPPVVRRRSLRMPLYGFAPPFPPAPILARRFCSCLSFSSWISRTRRAFFARRAFSSRCSRCSSVSLARRSRLYAFRFLSRSARWLSVSFARGFLSGSGGVLALVGLRRGGGFFGWWWSGRRWVWLF